jgi:hypothetical protein
MTSTRAIPNERLQTAFGVENSSTTTSLSYSLAFSRSATGKMRQAIGLEESGDKGENANWDPLIQRARVFVNDGLPADEQNPINLADLVQFVTLKPSMKYLFMLNEDE